MAARTARTAGRACTARTWWLDAEPEGNGVGDLPQIDLIIEHAQAAACAQGKRRREAERASGQSLGEWAHLHARLTGSNPASSIKRSRNHQPKARSHAQSMHPSLAPGGCMLRNNWAAANAGARLG